MERATGFEPATSTLARWRATNCAKPATQGIIYGNHRRDASENLKFFERLVNAAGRSHIIVKKNLWGAVDGRVVC